MFHSILNGESANLPDVGVRDWGKGDLCYGGKNSKDRVIVLLTASAAGEKLNLLVTGKSKKPRCLYGFEILTLGVN